MESHIETAFRANRRNTNWVTEVLYGHWAKLSPTWFLPEINRLACERKWRVPRAEWDVCKWSRRYSVDLEENATKRKKICFCHLILSATVNQSWKMDEKRKKYQKDFDE